MATTSIWSVKGWLGKVMIYVENPEKTMHPETAGLCEAVSGEDSDREGLADVIAYAVREEKTRRKNSGSDTLEEENGTAMQQYVTGINCTSATARSEMMAVKKRYGKDGGIMAWHGYQSFAPGECTPQMAHEIGVRLAEELWGSRFQVLVATHLDKAHHFHNHFVVNSVSFMDGKRYHRTKRDYRDMRNVSDGLCLEYGLSVIEHPEQGRGTHYAQWKEEQNGKPTYHSMVKEDVDEAVAKARTEKQFFHYLKEMGYSIKTGKDITVRAEGRDRGIKLARNFGGEYTIESIRKRILREQPVSRREPQNRNMYRITVKGSIHKTKKIGGLRGLYLHYCFLLGILPENRPPVSPKQIHTLFREDLIKLERISKETRLLCQYRIDTAEQLFSLKEDLQGQMADRVEARKHLRYQSRHITDSEKLAEVKTEISRLTKQIGKLRKEVVLCDGIAARSGVIKEKIEQVREENSRKGKIIPAGKEEKENEHIRRSR